jgi:hypothetical protein
LTDYAMIRHPNRMHMKTIAQLLILAVSLSLGLTASAQAPAPAPAPAANAAGGEQDSNPRFWQARFASGHYLVKLDRISSASKHEYVSDGVARVFEVTIGTDTAVVARFYYLEPVGKDTPIAAGSAILNRVQGLAQDVGSRASPSMAKLNVVKNYPASTHAHTVEYVVQSAATLESLYSSLMAAINTGKGRTWICSEK